MKPSLKLQREKRELHDPAHPRQQLSCDCELEAMDYAVDQAGRDEWATCFDPNEHPKEYGDASDPADPVCDCDGKLVDIQGDTPNIGVELGATDQDIFDGGLVELDDLKLGPL